MQIEEQVTCRRDGGLHRFVINIRAQGEVSLTDHAVSLGDTGEAAEGEQDQDGIID